MMTMMTMTTLAMMDGWMDDMTGSMKEGKGSLGRKSTVWKERSAGKRHSLQKKSGGRARTFRIFSQWSPYDDELSIYPPYPTLPCV